jgi:hypothetical protein
MPNGQTANARDSGGPGLCEEGSRIRQAAIQQDYTPCLSHYPSGIKSLLT